MSELLHESEPISSESQRHPSQPTGVPKVLITQPGDPLVKSDWHQLNSITLNTTVNYEQDEQEDCTAYTWHWRIDNILYDGDKKTCLRALAAG